MRRRPSQPKRHNPVGSRLIPRLRALAVSAMMVCLGCLQESHSQAPSHAASLTFSEKDTVLQVVRLEDSPWYGTQAVPVMDKTLGYGAMGYLVGRGAVPSWQQDVPAEYHNRQDLSLDALGVCVLKPILATLEPVLHANGLLAEDLPVTFIYLTEDDPAYEPERLEEANATIDAYVDRMGFDGRESLRGHTHGAYINRESSGFYRPDWMKRLADTRLLSSLSLPGTHDTMSHYGGDAVKTQSMRLGEQLNSGIRALDIRCRHIDNRFAIHHGFVYQNANFDDVLNTVASFLAKNPSETIIMRVKEEYDPSNVSRAFHQTFQYYLDSRPGLFWNFNGNNNPTLKEIRGKIVLFQNFSSPKTYGISWDALYIQDRYNLKTNWDLYDKWVAVRQHLDSAHRGAAQGIYVNFLSGSGGSFPYFVASGKSSPGTDAPLLSTGRTTPAFKNSYPDFPRVSCFLRICTIAFLGTNILTHDHLPRFGRVGIIMADFPGPALIQRVIDKN